MVHFILGGSGTGKSERLIQEIFDAVGRNKEVCIIIPDQYSFEFDKKLYSRLGAKRYNSVSIFSFTRLSREIFIKYGGHSGEYADDLTKTTLMFLALKEVSENGELCFYNKKAKSFSFVASALDIIKELKYAGITPDIISERLPFVHESIKDKLTDISVIYTAYEAELQKHGFKDLLTDISAAAETASREGYFDGKAVFVDEFFTYTGEEYSMLESVFSSADDVFITICTEDIYAGRGTLFSVNNSVYAGLKEIADRYNIKSSDEMMNSQHRFKSGDIAYLNGNILRSSGKSYKGSEHIHVFESSDVYDEADFVCSEICSLIREKDFTYHDFAVVSANLNNYAGILEAALLKYEIPYFMDMPVPVMHKSLFLMVMSLLGISMSKYPDTEDVLRYAKSDLIDINLDGELSEEKSHLELISELENYCYKWNIDMGLWLEPFIYDSEFPDAEKIRAALITPILEFKKKTENITGKQISKALYEFLLDVGTDRLLSFDYEEDDAEILRISRERKQLWNNLIAILDNLYDILGNTEIKLSDYANLLRALLSETKFAVPPQTLDSIIVSDTERVRFASPKVVFIIGANDGIFPRSVKNTGLFSEKDKTLLEKSGLKFLRTLQRRVAEERFSAYTALSSASDEVYVTYPLSDAGGKTLFPSYIIQHLRIMFGENIFSETKSRGLIRLCANEKSAYYQLVQNYSKNSAECASIWYVMEKSPIYGTRIKELKKINLNSDFNIQDKEITNKIFGEKLYIYPSRFEDFCKCPFMYFCKKGLGLRPTKKIEINASESGNIIHFCLCSILKETDRDSFVASSDEFIADKIDKTLKKYYMTEEMGGDFAKTARFENAYSNLSDTLFNIIIHLRDEFSQSGFVPSDFELKIDDNDMMHSRVLVSKNGTEIHLMGTIDRVDTCVIGEKTYVRVIDYKSGEKIFRLEDLLYGLNMQMLLYLFSVAESKGKYENALPAGVLYMPSHDIAPSLSRKDGEEILNAEKNKTFKMNGILIEDELSLAAMEKELSGIYIPVSKKLDGSFKKGSSLITQKQLDNLKKYADKLLIEMADALSDGKIPANPLVNKNVSPCDYCDYWSVCGGNAASVRVYEEDAKAKMENILNGADNDG